MDRHPQSLLSFLSSDTYVHSGLTPLPPPSELRVCYWLRYDVLTDGADVFSPRRDSLSELFSKLKGSGISWGKGIIGFHVRFEFLQNSVIQSESQKPKAMPTFVIVTV